jgi:glutathione S-transferase
MRLYLFAPSSRALGVVALKNHLAIDCELRPIDLGGGDQRAPEYPALNPKSWIIGERLTIADFSSARQQETPR